MWVAIAIPSTSQNEDFRDFIDWASLKGNSEVGHTNSKILKHEQIPMLTTMSKEINAPKLCLHHLLNRGYRDGVISNVESRVIIMVDSVSIILFLYWTRHTLWKLSSLQALNLSIGAIEVPSKSRSCVIFE